jgi:hypothetical protein
VKLTIHLQLVLSFRMPGALLLFLLSAYVSRLREIYILLLPLTYTKATVSNRVDDGDGDGVVFACLPLFVYISSLLLTIGRRMALVFSNVYYCKHSHEIKVQMTGGKLMAVVSV